MPFSRRGVSGRLLLPLSISVATSFVLAACSGPTPTASPTRPETVTAPAVEPIPENPYPVMLGIDVLEAQGFAALKGKNVALMTHVAGVNRRGESTLDVLRRAPGFRLVALFGVEHGIANDQPAGKNYNDYVDSRTGLKVFSLYTGRTDPQGKRGKPTKEQLQGIDALVIDLQDIGVRSYTFAGSMRYAMEGCFENGVEVIVLDRPNPLGGLKVDGPLLDRSLRNGLVAAYSVPYVHGLTIGEIAMMAKDGPGVLDIAENVRAKAKLTVIPMRGWHRSMRWPDTGLKFVPTSPNIQDFDAVIGYAMVGVGTEPALRGEVPSLGRVNGFTHGILVDGQGRFQFRSINYRNETPDQVLATLQAYRLPGLGFHKVTVKDRSGKDISSVYVDITDWNSWQPMELSFYLMRTSLQKNRPNPALAIKPDDVFMRYVGSAEFVNAMKRDGARINIEAWLQTWRDQNVIYQTQSKRYWLYQ